MNYYDWLGQLGVVDVKFPDRQFNGYWMLECEPVIGWHDYVIAVHLCDSTPEFDFGIAGNGWPVFSARLKEKLESLVPDAIQFLPFRLQRSDGSDQVRKYFVGQVLLSVDCIDRELTKVRKSWNDVNDWGDYYLYGPNHIVLAKSKIGDTALFRLHGHRNSIIVREDIKSAIEMSGFSGQRFDLMQCSE